MTATAAPVFTRIVVDNPVALRDMIDNIRAQEVVAFDTETRSEDYGKYKEGALRKMSMRVDLASFATPNLFSYVVPLGMLTLPCLDTKHFFASIKPVMEDASILKSAWNFSFDASAFLNYGVSVEHYEDEMVKAHLLDENRSVSLKERCHDVGMELSKYDFKTYWKARHAYQTEACNKKGERLAQLSDLAPLEKEYLTYSTEDAEATILLRAYLDAELAKAPKLKDLFHRLLNPTVRMLFNMERRGMPIDRDYLDMAGRQCRMALAEAEKKVFASAGQHFNLGSTKQLAKVLYHDLAYPVPKLTDKNAPSTDADALASLAQRGYKVAEDILRWRGYSKLDSAYLGRDSGLQEALYPWGSIHPSFNPCATTSGRLSSCVAADTVLETSGGTCKISDLTVDQEAPVTIITHEGRPRRILDVIKKPRAQMYRVKTTDGRTIDCTMDHRFLVQPAVGGDPVWKALRDIVPGDRLVCPAQDPAHATT